ncbi:MAG TPA: hypothetical protein V6D29_08750 [Leptolyngbyaceae cyanobacterium]
MNPTLLRQLWALIENSQSSLLLALDDHSLVQWLLEQLSKQRSLNRKETECLSGYIQSRLSLIRDLAESR